MKDKLIGIVIGLVLGSVVTVLAALPLDRNQREVLKFVDSGGYVAVRMYLSE